MLGSSPSSPPSSLSCTLQPPPSSSPHLPSPPHPFGDCSPFSCDRRGLGAKRDTQAHPSYAAARDAKRPSLGVRLELICRAFSEGGWWLQTETVCCPRAALQSSIAALLFPLPPSLTVQTGAMEETKAQPANQVMESIKSITQTSKRHHIFVHLRGGQQGD